MCTIPKQMPFPILLTLSLLLFAPPGAAQEGLKVYISADMEGVVGVVTGDHLGPTGFEYQKAREWLTGEDMVEISKFFSFMTRYRPDITP
jgi:hypothetical protein